LEGGVKHQTVSVNSHAKLKLNWFEGYGTPILDKVHGLKVTPLKLRLRMH